jgi:histidinol phosphatase-like PHP family hydrolase
VIEALVTKQIALEINARRSIPNEKIIRAAKEAGIRFAFGTNNGDSNMGKLEYCIEMMKKCGITERDMYFPVVRK